MAEEAKAMKLLELGDGAADASQITGRKKNGLTEEQIADMVINNKNYKDVKAADTDVFNSQQPGPGRLSVIPDKEEQEDEYFKNQDQLPQDKSVKATSGDKSNGMSSVGMSQGKSQFSSKRKSAKSIDIEGNSLYCIGPNNCLRLALADLVQNPYFEQFVMHLIGINSLFMALEEPVLTDEYTLATLKFFGDVVSALFIVESALKIFVMGFVIGKKTYLRDSFNVLDFVIVVISIVAWILEANEGFDISFVRAFRALRALRPLKLISKNEGMKLVVNSILNSVPSLVNVGLISMLFYFISGVIGLQMLAGRVSFCADEEGGMVEFNKEMCDAAGYEWVIPPYHYDNIFASMLTFFEVSTLEMWPDIMFAALDSSEEPDEIQVMDGRQALAMIYILFIFITTFFVMNLFISVIVRQFNQQKQNTEGSSDLSPEQVEWVKIQRFMAEVRPAVICVEPWGFHKPLEPEELKKKEKADLLRLHTSESAEDQISLKEYIARQKKGQKGIYYITGESRSAVAASPFLEEVKSRGYEVLYLVDLEHGRLFQQMKEYGGKKLIPCTKEGLEMDETPEIKDKRTLIVSTSTSSINSLSFYYRSDCGVLSGGASGTLPRLQDLSISSRLSLSLTLWPCAWNTTAPLTHTCTFSPLQIKYSWSFSPSRQ